MHDFLADRKILSTVLFTYLTLRSSFNLSPKYSMVYKFVLFFSFICKQKQKQNETI